MNAENCLGRVRIWLGVFIAGLVVSGLTAFPLEMGLRWAVGVLRSPSIKGAATATHLLPWVERVYAGLATTNVQFPFLAYGTDWLAFGHLVIAMAFVGAWRDPVRNKWLISFGLIACPGVVPLALIAGAIRGIPLGWRLIDCSFGMFGCLPLVICWRYVRELERVGVS
jgi:hypothetical protein